LLLLLLLLAGQQNVCHSTDMQATPFAILQFGNAMSDRGRHMASHF